MSSMLFGYLITSYQLHRYTVPNGRIMNNVMCRMLKWSWPVLMYCLSTCLKRLRKTKKTSVRITDIHAKIQTKDLQHMKQECQLVHHDTHLGNVILHVSVLHCFT